MRKQLKQILEKLNRKRGLLFAIIFSMALFAASIFFFALESKLTYLTFSVFILPYSGVLFFLLREISNTKKISEELRMQKDNYRVTLNSLGEGLISTDKEGRIRYMNSSAERLTGFSWQEAKNQPLEKIYNVVSEEAGMLFEHIVHRILKDGNRIEWENNTILKTKDSATFIISNSGSPIFDSKGNIDGAVVVFKSISEKKKAENDLRMANQRLTYHLNNSPLAIIEWDKNFIIKRWSVQAEKIFEWSKPEILNKHFNDLNLVFEEDAPGVAVIAGELMNGTVNSNKSVNRNNTKSGKVITCQWFNSVLKDEKGNILSIQSLILDITEQIKSEEKIKQLSQAVEQSPASVVITDTKGDIEYVNQKFIELTGYTAAEAIGKNTRILKSGYTSAVEYKNMWKQISSGHEWRGELYNKKKNGEFYWEYALISPILNGKSEIINFLAIKEDITERKKTEEELLASRAQFKNLVENISGVYWINDLETFQTLYISPSYETIWGRKCEDLYKNSSDFINAVHPEDKAQLFEAYKNISDTLKADISYRIVRPDGEIRWIETKTNVVIDNNGNKTEYGYAEDITERKKAEENLREAHQRLTYHLNNSPLAIIEWDKNFIINSWSVKAENIFGWDGSEVVNKHFNDLNLVFEEDAPGVAVIAKELMTGAVDSNKSINRNITKSGKVIYCQWFNSVLKDEKGNIRSILSLIQDITEQKKNENRLKHSEERYRLLFQNNPLPVFMLALPELTLVDVNEAAIKQYGYSKEEFIQLPVTKLVHKEDLSVVFKDAKQQNRKELNRVGIIRHRKKDGSIIHVDIITHDIIIEGNQIRLILAMDITEKLKALERYDILARATSDTIWDWDINNNSILYNNGIETMFGYPHNEILNGVEWWNKNVHPDDRQSVNMQLQQAFKKMITTIHIEYRYRCFDNTYKHILDRCYIIYDTANKPIRIIGAMQDITYQFQEEIRMSRVVIDAQERERQEIGMELHDNVKQILSATLIYLGMAQDEIRSKEKIAEFIEMSRGFILDSITEIRRLSHQLAPASFENISLLQVIKSLIKNMNPDNHWQVDLQIDDISMSNIDSDTKVNLYRILQEQLSNIKKYADAEKIVVSIMTVENRIQLKVADNGKGFDPATTKKGIGLENIKRRVEVFAGNYIINTALGKGCELVVELPL